MLPDSTQDFIQPGEEETLPRIPLVAEHNIESEEITPRVTLTAVGWDSGRRSSRPPEIHPEHWKTMSYRDRRKEAIIRYCNDDKFHVFTRDQSFYF